ncbi:MAG: AMP-binding protein, partial [Planctomycetota bacterium]
PNFGYDLCVDRIAPAERLTLDLSTWRVAFNGAERIKPETLRRFAAAFASAKFTDASFLPCYGLAEATLIVTGVGFAPPVTVGLDRAELAGQRAGSSATAEILLADCGPPAPGVGVAVVDPVTCQRLDDGRIGEVWVAGPSVARGYWRTPEQDEAVFRARVAGEDGEHYLRTGDMGFLREGRLVVTGRRKEMLIIRGENHCPQDIEAVVERSDDTIRTGAVAAFGTVVAGEVFMGCLHLHGNDNSSHRKT